MTYLKRTHLPAVPSTAFHGPLRPFLCVNIMLSVLCLASCGSTRAAARAQMKRQAVTDVQTGVSLELTSQEGTQTRENPMLELPVSAIDSLPEGAEYSSQEGNTLVSVKKLKGDSVRIRATSLNPTKPRIDLKLNSSVTSLTSDTTDAVADAGDRPLPRGQPKASSSSRESLFVGMVLLVIMGIVAYDSFKPKKQ